jgi:tripartite motif-containing protein 71
MYQYIGSKGNENGQFSGLNRIAIDADDNTFFEDWENHLIQKFNKYGYWLLKIRQRGSGDSEFHRAWDFAVCKANGKIFVSDTDENHRVQVFSSVQLVNSYLHLVQND